jgi:hypothetical protein
VIGCARRWWQCQRVEALRGPVVTHERLPSNFLTWSERKQDRYVRDLLRSMSPGPTTGPKSNRPATPDNHRTIS